MNRPPNAVPGTDKASLDVELIPWLASGQLSHFITLTANTSNIPESIMRDRLRVWDARVNRALYGPKWKKHHDDLIWYYAFLEKPRSNPHWHLLLRVVGRWGSDLSDEFKRLPILAENTWLELMPSGTVDIQEIDQMSKDQLVFYLVKELGFELQYANFVTPDEWRFK